MGCVNPKNKKTWTGAVQGSTVPPEVPQSNTYNNQQSTVSRSAMPISNGSHMYGPPPTMPSTMMQNSMVKVPPLLPAYQPPALNNSGVVSPLEVARGPIGQSGMMMPAGPNVGRQPLIKQGNQSVEVPAQLRDAARNMNFVPVNINPMGSPTYDVNSNYAVEATQVGGVHTIMDQRVMDLNMDLGASNHTPKIYTYTYGNMMSTGGPLMGSPAGPRAAAY